jgi:hypothetical protein
MLDWCLGLVCGLIGGFIVSINLARWVMSDMREHAQRAIRLRNQAEEVIDNCNAELKKLRKANGALLNQVKELQRKEK